MSSAARSRAGQTTREETAVNAAAARKLITIGDLGEALAWTDVPAGGGRRTRLADPAGTAQPPPSRRGALPTPPDAWAKTTLGMHGHLWPDTGEAARSAMNKFFASRTASVKPSADNLRTDQPATAA